MEAEREREWRVRVEHQTINPNLSPKREKDGGGFGERGGNRVNWVSFVVESE